VDSQECSTSAAGGSGSERRIVCEMISSCMLRCALRASQILRHDKIGQRRLCKSTSLAWKEWTLRVPRIFPLGGGSGGGVFRFYIFCFLRCPWELRRGRSRGLASPELLIDLASGDEFSPFSIFERSSEHAQDNNAGDGLLSSISPTFTV
jgi:hypothetical protein